MMTRYRIRPLTLSRALAEKGIMTYLAHYGEKIWRPYTFWVIEGTGLNILVDTAIHAEDYRNYHPGFRNYPIEPLMTFEEGLAKVSLKPENVDIVVQTHLHFDHCYNTSKCKHAKVIVQEAEWRFARKPHPVFSVMYSKSLLKGLHVEIVRGRKKLLPGIELIPSPGHSPGGQSVAIETKVGRVIIAGFCSIKDNFYPREDIREKVSPIAGYPVMVPGIHFDAFKAYQSACKIKELADLILPIHDPEIMDLEVIPKS